MGIFWKYFKQTWRWIFNHKPDAVSAIVEGGASVLDNAREAIIWLRNQFNPATCEPEFISAHAKSRNIKKLPGETEDQFTGRVINALPWMRRAGKRLGMIENFDVIGWPGTEVINCRTKDETRWAEFEIELDANGRTITPEVIKNITDMTNEQKPARSKLAGIGLNDSLVRNDYFAGALLMAETVELPAFIPVPYMQWVFADAFKTLEGTTVSPDKSVAFQEGRVIQKLKSYKGDGTAYIAVPGLLVSDIVEVAAESGTPAISAGRLDIAVDVYVWDITIKRAGIIWAHYSCADSNSKVWDSSGNGNHGTKMNATLATFIYNSEITGSDTLNTDGYTDDPIDGIIPANLADATKDAKGGTLQFSGKAQYNLDVKESNNIKSVGASTGGNYGEFATPVVGSNEFSVVVKFRLDDYPDINNGILTYGAAKGTGLGVCIRAYTTAIFIHAFNSEARIIFGTVNKHVDYIVIMTYNPQTKKLKAYLDGVFKGEVEETLNISSYSYLAAYWNANNSMQGDIYFAEVFNKELSQAEITAIYNDTLSVNDGCVSRWFFGEGGGFISHDIIGSNDITFNRVTESVMWGAKQNSLHYNLLNGHTLYQKAGSLDIRMPFVNGQPHPTIPSGYTKVADYPAGNGSNNSESSFYLPAVKELIDGQKKVGMVATLDAVNDCGAFGLPLIPATAGFEFSINYKSVDASASQYHVLFLQAVGPNDYYQLAISGAPESVGQLYVALRVSGVSSIVGHPAVIRDVKLHTIKIGRVGPTFTLTVGGVTVSMTSSLDVPQDVAHLGCLTDNNGPHGSFSEIKMAKAGVLTNYWPCDEGQGTTSFDKVGNNNITWTNVVEASLWGRPEEYGYTSAGVPKPLKHADFHENFMGRNQIFTDQTDPKLITDFKTYKEAQDA